jgi:serine O-acetyltransferase
VTSLTSPRGYGPDMGQLVNEIAGDLTADLGEGVRGWRRIVTAALRLAFTARLQAVVLHRLASAAGRRASLLGVIIKYINQVLTGADMAYQATLGPGLQLFHPNGVVIGPDVVAGARCTIQQGVTLGLGPRGAPRLGDDVRLGPGAKLYDAITIGDRAKIGANAVVQIDVPADAFAAGVPARIISIAGERVGTA